MEVGGDTKHTVTVTGFRSGDEGVLYVKIDGVTKLNGYRITGSYTFNYTV